MVHVHQSSLILVYHQHVHVWAFSHSHLYLSSSVMPHPQIALSHHSSYTTSQLANKYQNYPRKPYFFHTLMAMHTKSYVVAVYVLISVLHHHFDLISASHPRKIQPPAPVQAIIKSSPPPPERAFIESKPAVRALIKPNRRAIIGGRINRYKKTQTDAYRPTSPGNSPGMGHDVPPRAIKP